MRLKRSILLLAVLVLTIVSCASTPKGRYYENLDMYDFVMTEFRAHYETAPIAEQHQMDKQVLPLLNAWKSARLIWKADYNDAGKEQAAMLAYSQAKAAVIHFGIITVQEFQEVE